MKINLSKASIEKITPQPHQFFVWDSKVSGLGLRVSAGGSKTFVIQSRIDGKEKKITIGKYGILSPDQARKTAISHLAKMQQGIDPSPSRKCNSLSLGELMEGYVSLLKLKGKVSAREVDNVVAKHIKNSCPRLWKKAAKEITKEDCKLIFNKLTLVGKRRQADKVRSYIKSAYSAAIDADNDADMPEIFQQLNLQDNPARDLKKIKGSSNARNRALSLNELRLYWQRLEKLPEPKKSILKLHVLTGGQRQQQLLRLTLSEVDFDSKYMVLKDSKGRREEPRRHIVPLLPEAINIIKSMMPQKYIFSCNGGVSPVDISYIQKIVRMVSTDMVNSGEVAEPFSAGTIRATIESRLIARPYKVTSDVLAQLLSHGLGGVQQRHYQHHDFFDEKLEALIKLYSMVTNKEQNVIQLRVSI